MFASKKNYITQTQTLNIQKDKNKSRVLFSMCDKYGELCIYMIMYIYI